MSPGSLASYLIADRVPTTVGTACNLTIVLVTTDPQVPVIVPIPVEVAIRANVVDGGKARPVTGPRDAADVLLAGTDGERLRRPNDMTDDHPHGERE